MARHTTRTAVAIAALAVELQAGAAPAEFRLIPAAPFRSVDTRPEGVDAWYLTAAAAETIVAAASARQSDYVIDFEHQTLHKEKNGQPAPAAGWFKTLEWREGDGLYATDVRWTAAAAELIADGKYRYVSPVFGWIKATGAIVSIQLAALTNTPGIDGLTDLAALAAAIDLPDQPEQESHMDELLEQLRWLLNLPVGATADDVKAQLQKLMDQLKPADATAAATFDLAKFLNDSRERIVALTAQVAAPDPAKFVEVATLTAVQSELATTRGELQALKSEKQAAAVDRVVTDALTAGKLTPATEKWARDLGAKDLAALTAYVEAAPVVMAPGTTQTAGTRPSGTATTALSADQSKVCALMSIDPNDYAKTLADTSVN